MQNKISLSSWNYGTFSFTNPYYKTDNLRRDIDKNNIIVNKNNNNIKIVKKEYFDNLSYENYINRELHLKNEFRLKLEQERIEGLEMLKKKGQTFKVWEKQKNKQIKIGKLKKLNEEIPKKLKTNEIQKNMRISFTQWNEKKLKKERELEEKKIEEEKKLKSELDKRNKERKKKMKKWKRAKSELIKKGKIKENMIQEEKKIKEEKEEKEKKEKNKIEFINWLNNKKIQEENKKLQEKIENKKRNLSSKYKRIKMNEIIGPFSFAKDLKEAQKNYYKDIKNLYKQ